MTFSAATRTALRVFTALVLLFVHAPLALVVLNSFNTSRTFEWPPPGLTTQWWSAAVDSDVSHASTFHRTTLGFHAVPPYQP